MWRSKPIVITVSAALASFGLVFLLERFALGTEIFSSSSLWYLLIGLAYTQLLEFWCHRVPMHKGIPFLSGIKKDHLTHHRIFHGDHFRSSDLRDLNHISGRWHVFPMLFLLHYTALQFIVPSEFLVAFLAGAVFHYTFFEVTHWFTHVEDNRLDRWIDRVPLLNRVRSYQILHHRLHHETPNVAFNFTPPYAGDLLMAKMPRSFDVTESSESPQPVYDLVLETPSRSLGGTNMVSQEPGWWNRPVIRYGSVIAVGLIALGATYLMYDRMPQKSSLGSSTP